MLLSAGHQEIWAHSPLTCESENFIPCWTSRYIISTTYSSVSILSLPSILFFLRPHILKWKSDWGGGQDISTKTESACWTGKNNGTSRTQTGDGSFWWPTPISQKPHIVPNVLPWQSPMPTLPHLPRIVLFSCYRPPVPHVVPLHVSEESHEKKPFFIPTIQKIPVREISYFSHLNVMSISMVTRQQGEKNTSDCYHYRFYHYI